MKEVPGRINTKNAKPPNPKPSPKGFVWPSQQDHDDKVAEKIAASLQELLPAREWKHTDLAGALYGTAGANESPRNVGATRRWVVAEHPIPNEQTAGYIAEVLGVSMARLLEPEGKFAPFPPMIRGRSDSKRFPFKGKPDTHATKSKEKKEKRPYVRRVPMPGNGAAKEVNGDTWVLAAGLTPPTYTIASSTDHAGHVALEVKGVLPHQRAMAILHILQHQVPDKE